MSSHATLTERVRDAIAAELDQSGPQPDPLADAAVRVFVDYLANPPVRRRI